MNITKIKSLVRKVLIVAFFALALVSLRILPALERYGVPGVLIGAAIGILIIWMTGEILSRISKNYRISFTIEKIEN
jgi:uncharacterized membrane protein YjjB (DUF3815 family)